MSNNNNNPDPWATNPTQNRTGNNTPWNAPGQSANGQPYYPPTTATGYNAQYPLSSAPYIPTAVPPIAPDEAYRQAEKRVNARLRFYKHLSSYLIVNAFLWAIALISWLSSGMGSLWTLIWPIWVSVFWGIGLVSDYVQTFGLNENTRQRMIEDEIRRMNRR